MFLHQPLALKEKDLIEASVAQLREDCRFPAFFQSIQPMIMDLFAVSYDIDLLTDLLESRKKNKLTVVVAGRAHIDELVANSKTLGYSSESRLDTIVDAKGGQPLTADALTQFLGAIADTVE